MLALRIEYLSGVAVAQRRTERSRAEWPPHPDRLFSALVAAWGHGGCRNDEADALRWLEAQPPPAIAGGEAAERTVVTHWVPANDVAVADKSGQRNGRPFPAVTLKDPAVHFVWREAAPGPHTAALAALAARVSYLGHSTSLVRAAPAADPPAPRWVPAEAGPMKLRVPAPGRLAQLVANHVEGRLPPTSGFAGYRDLMRQPAPPPAARFGEWIVFRRAGGIGLGLEHTLRMTDTLHRALISVAPQPPRPVITGRDATGRCTRDPHVALVPLANLDHDHADGRVMGVAVVYPAGIGPVDRDHVDAALAGLDHLALPGVGRMALSRVVPDETGPRALLPERYTRPSARWVTATPMLLDRHPKRGRDAVEETIARACRTVGLPKPRAARPLCWPAAPGVPRAQDFVPRPGRRHDKPVVHVEIEFDERVAGPVLIGAGRFFGMGLCLPRFGRDREAPA